MAFRELSGFVQVLVFLALAVVIIVAGEFVPYSPVEQVRSDLERTKVDAAKLRTEVAQLQVYDRRYTEFRVEMEALQKQLETLKTIVPEEKELDEFIRMLQGGASSSGVEIRRLTAKPVVTRDYHYEMPFELEIDGPYFAILDFFARLGRLSRIINVGDLTFKGLAEATGRPRYPIRPGTTVTGTVTATTFFTKGLEAPAPAPAGKQPGKQ